MNILPLYSTKTDELIEVAVELEMRLSDIVKEVRGATGAGLIETLDLVMARIMELHRKGNQKATLVAQRWNANDPSRKFKL